MGRLPHLLVLRRHRDLVGQQPVLHREQARRRRRPLTEWLPPEVKRDEWGYILTGPEAGGGECLQYESTMPGVFAVGDVRRTSVKRVASAVGEGAVCVRLLHEHLARPNEGT